MQFKYNENTMSNWRIISDLSEFDNLQNFKFGDPFLIKCTRCGNLQPRRFDKRCIDSYKTMRCISCNQTIRQTKFNIIDPISVSSKEEILALPRIQPFKYICKVCGKEIINKKADTRSAETFNGICTSCKNSIRCKKHINVPIMVNNIDQFKSFVRHQSFSFICKKCGKLHTLKLFNNKRIEDYGLFLCEHCLRSLNMKENKNGHFGKSRYTYMDGSKFDSAWELAIYIYANDHCEDIIREPIGFSFKLNDETHYCYPDFLYNGEFIEIKGDHFFDKLTGKMINPYDESQNDLYEAKHQCELSNGVKFWGKKECLPYIEYVNEVYGIRFLYSFRNGRTNKK